MASNEGDNIFPEVSTSDRNHLLGGGVRRRCGGSCFGHKRLCWFLLALLFVVAANALAIYFIYFRCSVNNSCVDMKVMALNTWGMPERLGSQFKQQRMDGIAREISKGKFDVYLLEELWMQPDHETIAASIPANYSITGFRQLGTSGCDGRALPTGCSGLAIISRFPFKEVEFNAFADHGDPLKMFVDGEWFARKGVGRVQVEPLPNVTVDVFVTHTAADPEAWHGYNNSYYRKLQTRELMDKRIDASKADVIVLGGDFNAGPVEHEGSPFEMVRREMQNAVEELFYKLNRWLNPQYTTYGNPANTFSGRKYEPIMYDYIFRRNNAPEKVTSWTSLFELPLYKTNISKALLSSDLIHNIEDIIKDPCPFRAFTSIQNETLKEGGNEDKCKDTVKEKGADTIVRTKRSGDNEDDDGEAFISFSDHEAVTSTIYIWG